MTRDESKVLEEKFEIDRNLVSTFPALRKVLQKFQSVKLLNEELSCLGQVYSFSMS